MKAHLKGQNFRIIPALIIFLLTVTIISNPATAEWNLGEPITTYWCGPGYYGGGALDDAACQRMVNAGFNLVWARTIADLNMAQKYGLRALWNGWVTDDRIVNELSVHPALYGYLIADEPSSTTFSTLAETVSHYRSLDPNHLMYINLLPQHSSNLGVSDYRTYLNQFQATVHPTLLSYDNYSLMSDHDGWDYFLNLAVVSNSARAAGVPFMNIIQACQYTSDWRNPTSSELRFLYNTSLAYGASGICNFVYKDPSAISGGMVDNEGNTTELYDEACILNPMFVAISKQINALKRVNTYHLGDLPKGYGTNDSSPMRLPDNSPFYLIPDIADTKYVSGEPVEGLVMGIFGEGGILGNATMIYLVNEDYENGMSTAVKYVGQEPLSVYNVDTGEWIPQGHNWAYVTLEPGGGVLIALTSTVPEPSTIVLFGMAWPVLTILKRLKKKV